LLKAQNRRVLLRLDNVDRTTTAPASYSRNSPQTGEINAMEALALRAFDVCVFTIFFLSKRRRNRSSFPGSGNTMLLSLRISHPSKTPTTKYGIGLPSSHIRSCKRSISALTTDPVADHLLVLSAVASRFEENRELVESNRMEATRLIRDTLFAEAALTLDDVCCFFPLLR